MTLQIERLREALADRYRIERELGAGGMATVYLAQDLKHDRLVAVKVLKPELAAVLGAERFVVEIKTTASMSHPHILPLFDSGSADGFLFYVMPYIEGETLRDRLNRETQLGIDDAVRIAREVLDALEYAHTRGVIHRDIKPENILMQGARPMIADFGIALAVSAAAGGRMTETGLSLGTPHYMSPEQATAEKEITGRADIYSLASVLYEMLTGEPPHMGNSAQQIIMKIITEPAAAVTKFRKSVPANVAAAVAKALEKLPADRFGSAQAFADALGNPTFALSTTAMTASGFTSAQPRRAFAAAFPWLLVVGALAFAAYSQLSRSPGLPSPVMRFSLQWEGKGRFVDGSGSPIAFSPDGERIVYLGVDDDGVQWLYARALGRVEPMQIAGTRGAIAPIVSPDGAHVGFIQDGMIRTVMLDGGSTVTVAEANTNSMAWGNDGFIYYTSGEKLLRVTASGGTPEVVLSADSARGEVLRWPDPLPDGRSVLLTLVRDGAPVLAVGSISDGTVTELGRGGMYPRYVDGGHLVFLQLDGTLFGVSFDMRRARITGTPAPIADDVRFGPAYPAKLGISRTGSLAYAGGEAARREVVITDRRGVATVMPEDDRLYSVPRFSPDGRRLALTTLEFSARTTSDLWSVEIANGNASRLTFDSLSRYGVWTRDGERLVVIRDDSLFQMPADGSGEAQLLLVAPQSIAQVELFPDGRNVALVTSGSGGDISTVPLDSPQVVRPLVRTAFSERAVAISPDGQWIAYVSNETQVDEVYVRRAREGGGKWKVTRGGGREPRWGADGRELLYRKSDTVLAVTVRPGAEPQFGDPLPLFVGSFNSSFNQPSWDVSRDGQRFAFTRSRNQNERLDMHVIVHWFENHSAQQRQAVRK